MAQEPQQELKNLSTKNQVAHVSWVLKKLQSELWED